MEWILSLKSDFNSLIVKCEQPRHWSNHGRETDHIRELSVVAMDNNLRNVVLVLAHDKSSVKPAFNFSLES